MTSTAPPYHLPANASQDSLRAPTLPPYSEYAGAISGNEAIELANLSRPTSASSSAPTNTIGASPSPFTPTKHLQIQTPGKNLISLPTPQRPDPIAIFTLTPEDHLDRPLYLSVRPDPRSGSCFLAYGDDASQTPLSTTTYRFGPGRPPVVVLGDPARNPAIASAGGEGEGEGEGKTGAPGFEITGRSLFSRAVGFHVAGLGSFGWRYGNTAEHASAGADSLLICEIFLPEEEATASSSSSSSPHVHATQQKKSLGARLGFKKQSDGDADRRDGDGGGGSDGDELFKKGTARRIAQLVRNDRYRTPGTTRSSAGNGGRLMLDLRGFDEKVRERAEWLVVTTAVTMLKREVDRRRAQQIAAIGAIVS